MSYRWSTSLQFGVILIASMLTCVMPARASTGVAVGEVILATGEVWKVDGASKLALSRGDKVQEGDVLQTASGQLILRMSDGGLISLRENTKTSLDQYKNRQVDTTGAVRITVEQGIVRSSTGEIGEKDKSKFRVNTPFSALGIRGTDFITSVDSSGQMVYVVKGEIALSPFNSATGCNANGLGECSGSSVKTLAASNDSVLSLSRSQKVITLSKTVPDFLRPIDPESRFFASAANAWYGLLDTQTRSELGYDKLHDREGNPIQPYSRSSQRAIFAGAVEYLLPTEVARSRDEHLIDSTIQSEAERLSLANQLLLDPRSSDTDRDGVSDLAELSLGLNPWRADTDFDGVLDGQDSAPRVQKVTYFSDLTASPVSTAMIRSDLQDVNNTIDRFSLSNFGKLGFYTASSSTRNSTYSMWVDPQHQRLWGQKRVVDTLLNIRDLPESVTVWGTLPQLAADLAPNATQWLGAVGKSTAELYSLNLGNQTIVYTPTVESPKATVESPAPSSVTSLSGKVYRVEFTQSLNLQNPIATTAVERFNSPLFKNLTTSGDAFQFEFTTRGEEFRLTGSASSDGVLTARDGDFQMRGIQSGNTLVLMLSDEKSGRQFMVGLAEQDSAGKAIDPIAVEMQTIKTSSGVNWGRWQNFASLKPEDLSKLVGPDALANSRFILYKPNAKDLPQAGRFEFFLQDHEAVYTHQQVVRPAEVSNPFLQVDFDKQKFTTTFDVKAPGVELTNIRGAGDVSKQGLMVSNTALSNAAIQGVLADQAKAAALLFEKQLADGGVYSGVTLWGR